MTQDIVDILKSKNKTLAVAESLTAGLVASEIVDISGASNVFKGGIVAYMLEIKESLLDIPLSHTTKTDGVDLETAKMMAKNVSLKLDSDFGISTTGIAEAWDDRIEQAFICVYDRELDDYTFEHLLYEPDMDDKFYINRDYVRKATTSSALFLLLAKLESKYGA